MQVIVQTNPCVLLVKIQNNAKMFLFAGQENIDKATRYIQSAIGIKSPLEQVLYPTFWQSVGNLQFCFEYFERKLNEAKNALEGVGNKVLAEMSTIDPRIMWGTINCRQVMQEYSAQNIENHPCLAIIIASFQASQWTGNDTLDDLEIVQSIFLLDN